MPLVLLLLACAAGTLPGEAPSFGPDPAAAPTHEAPAPAGEPPSSAPADGVQTQLLARPLAYTHHARCRMGCRQVSEAEVAQILAEGTLVPERTRTDGACTSYAFEGTSSDGQELRIVYAGCDDETRVVTTIDLGREWPCDCD